MDFITHLPRTKAGYIALYVVVERLTELGHVIPTTGTATAAEVAQLFLDAVFRNNGLPRNIMSDRGVKFTSSFWTAFCEQVGINLKMSSAYHPMARLKGQTESLWHDDALVHCFLAPHAMSFITSSTPRVVLFGFQGFESNSGLLLTPNLLTAQSAAP